MCTSVSNVGKYTQSSCSEKLTVKIWFWLVKAISTIWSWVGELVNVAWRTVICRTKDIAHYVAQLGSKNAARTLGIRHVFVLMLENRSFDHMLGFSGISGTDAITRTPTSLDGLIGNPHYNLDPGDSTNAQVFAIAPADFKIPVEDKDPGHEFNDVLEQLSGRGAAYPDPATGKYPPINNSGFIASYRNHGSAHPTNIMKCFAPEQVPVLTVLAREYAVCDRWFSSVPGPTWPNRFFVHAASSGGLDDSPSGFRTASSTLIDGYKFENGTIFDRLDEKCVDWEIFTGDEFPQSFSISGMNLNALKGRFTDFEDFADRVNNPNYSPSYVFIEPNYGNILPTNSEDFTCGNSQHPLDDVTRGERLIKQVYEIIRNSPHWESSILIVAYDEHGGFYDHVTPLATVAPGDIIMEEDNNHHNFNFTQLGVRVPAVVVSPMIPSGIIDHTVYDHTSILATVERLFDLKPLTNRDAQANDLLHLFSLPAPRKDAPTVLPYPAVSDFRCEGDLEDIHRSPTYPSGEPMQEEKEKKEAEEYWKEIFPPIRGFLHVSLLKHLSIIPLENHKARNKITDEFIKIRGEKEARAYIHAVRQKVRAIRDAVKSSV